MQKIKFLTVKMGDLWLFCNLFIVITAVDSCNYTSIMCVPTLYPFPICICKLYFLVFWCYLHFRPTPVTKLVIESRPAKNSDTPAGHTCRQVYRVHCYILQF